MRAGGAGCGGSRIWSFRAGANGDESRGQVNDGSDNKKWRDAPRPVLEQRLVLALDDLEPADAAADIDAYALFVLFAHLEAGAGHGAFSGRDAKLNEPPHLLDFFFLDVAMRIETLHFAGYLATEIGGVEGRNPRDAALAVAYGLPSVLGADPYGRNQADTCYNHSA